MTSTAWTDDILRQALVSPEGRADPYPLYAKLVGGPALHRSEGDGLWYAVRHSTCRQLLQDQRLGHDRTGPLRRPGIGEGASAAVRERLAQRRRLGFSMLTANPPDHSRLRGMVNRAFTPRRVQELRDRIAALVDDHLGHIAEVRTADVMAELAFPLPIMVISELLGVPAEAGLVFRTSITDGLRFDGREPTEEELRRADAALEERRAFFRGLLNDRRRTPRDDMLSALVAVRDEEDGRLSEEELMAMVVLLYFAGFVTTTNLIGNGLLALLRHPAEMARLWSDAGLVPSAVEEMLRYDSPVQFVTRDVLEPAEVDGAVLEPGTTAVAIIGAANRDPERFSHPDRLDVGRPDNHPLSFGAGIHFCLGAPLARLEAQVVFGRIRERFTEIELRDDDPPLAQGFLRGRQRLLVEVRPR
jgi:cytochrome P450